MTGCSPYFPRGLRFQQEREQANELGLVIRAEAADEVNVDTFSMRHERNQFTTAEPGQRQHVASPIRAVSNTLDVAAPLKPQHDVRNS